MEKIFMGANSLIELEFLTNRKSYSHFHENLDIVNDMIDSYEIL